MPLTRGGQRALPFFGTPDLTEPQDELFARLAGQTHTPLDGLPIEPQATYVVVARHPLDAAVSLYHQGENDWLVEWVDDDPAPAESLDSLPGVMWHLAGAR